MLTCKMVCVLEHHWYLANLNVGYFDGNPWLSNSCCTVTDVLELTKCNCCGLCKL